MATSRVHEFLSSDEWDAPFFKRLADNDTGRAAGHQAGLVIPKALRPFFPALDEGGTSRATPTVDRRILVHMFIGLRHVGEGRARYQFQTWGGERSAEARLTDNLTPIRGVAKEGDILVFQRSADTLDEFRLVLFRRPLQIFSEINSLSQGRRWGPLTEGQVPITDADLEYAEKQFDEFANEPFVIQIKRQRVESRRSRVARSSAFPGRVNREYAWTCAVSDVVLRTPSNLYEVQAAHVVPVSEGGPDDVRNGFSLSHTLHWAFDCGLFGVRADRTVYVPRRIRRNNRLLENLAGKRITEARTEHLRVHEKGLCLAHETSGWQLGVG